MYDVTRETTSNLGYGYSIERENLLTLASIEIVDRSLEERVHISEDEKLLLNIYYNFGFKNIFKRRIYTMKDKILYRYKGYICNIKLIMGMIPENRLHY